MYKSASSTATLVGWFPRVPRHSCQPHADEKTKKLSRVLAAMLRKVNDVMDKVEHNENIRNPCKRGTAKKTGYRWATWTERHSKKTPHPLFLCRSVTNLAWIDIFLIPSTVISAVVCLIFKDFSNQSDNLYLLMRLTRYFFSATSSAAGMRNISHREVWSLAWQ